MADVEALYRLPFDTNQNPIRISQGNNGPWSHSGTSTNAVDFVLPFGTPITAARDGVVTEFQDISDIFYEGLDPEIGNSFEMRVAVNYIRIVHEKDENGQLVSLYCHLAKRGIVKKTGEIVRAGEIIGYTGKSGWVAEIPHLHFEVRLMRRGGPFSIPIRFIDHSDSLDHETLLREGKIYFGEELPGSV